MTVEQRTFQEDTSFWATSCQKGFTSKNITMTFRYSTDQDDASVEPERRESCSGGYCGDICSGTSNVYPESPLWVNHKGWDCQTFLGVDVVDSSGALVGSLGENCQISISPTADASKPITLKIRSLYTTATANMTRSCQ
jgi:hypothetical protein